MHFVAILLLLKRQRLKMEMAFFGAGPVDKLRISTKIKSIAVEAFGRHLKRVDASALFFW